MTQFAGEQWCQEQVTGST